MEYRLSGTQEAESVSKTKTASLSDNESYDTLRFTSDFNEQNAMDGRIVQWLEANGRHCDCEALNNVEPIVADAIPGYGQIRSETQQTAEIRCDSSMATDAKRL
jgi:hypothetical protein